MTLGFAGAFASSFDGVIAAATAVGVAPDRVATAAACSVGEGGASASPRRAGVNPVQRPSRKSSIGVFVSGISNCSVFVPRSGNPAHARRLDSEHGFGHSAPIGVERVQNKPPSVAQNLCFQHSSARKRRASMTRPSWQPHPRCNRSFLSARIFHEVNH